MSVLTPPVCTMLPIEVLAVRPAPPWAAFNERVTGETLIPVGAPIEFQPMASSVVRSAGVTASTAPDAAKASRASLATEEAQSPASPPATVLKLSRLVTPPLTEKYPGVEAEKSRTPAD